jgi:hypothetical protein
MIDTNEIQQKVQSICDAHSGPHLFEGGYGLSCFVSVCVDADGEKVTVRNAAYGNGLQLGAAFSDAMKAAGFNEFDVVLD